MDTFIITPKNKEEAELLKWMAEKMGLSFQILSAEEREDYALGKLMDEGRKSKKIPRSEIMKILGK